MEEFLYVPVLKSKQNEMLALKRLKSELRNVVLPCIDLVAPSKEKDLAKAREFVARNIKQLVSRIKGFPTLLLDSSEIDADLRLDNAIHPLEAAAGSLLTEGIQVIPVVGLYRDTAHIAAAKKILKQANSSTIAVRLDSYDIDTPSQTAKQYKEFIATQIGELNIILVFDSGNLHGADVEAVVNSIISLDSKIDSQSIILKVLAGSGIPGNISDAVPAKSAGYIDRKELDVFRRYQAATSKGALCPAIFGDYATVNPNYVELDWALINRTISPKIIYALKGRWFVIRGGSFRSHPDGYDQYHDLAAEVRLLPSVSATDFSFADEFIADCAAKLDGPSGPGYWAGICINRHISITADLARNNMLI